MRENDPLVPVIHQKQEIIQEESQLVSQKKKRNYFALGTSFLLFLSLLVTVIRTLLTVLR